MLRTGWAGDSSLVQIAHRAKSSNSKTIVVNSRSIFCLLVNNIPKQLSGVAVLNEHISEQTNVFCTIEHVSISHPGENRIGIQPPKPPSPAPPS
jgi:hypothetical protein